MFVDVHACLAAARAAHACVHACMHRPSVHGMSMCTHSAHSPLAHGRVEGLGGQRQPGGL
jgi:hypothetical protein